MRKQKRHILKQWLSQTKKENGLDSTLMNTDSSSTSSPLLRQDITLPASLYRTCDQLKYGSFIQIMISGDLSHLIISGSPSEDELLGAWEEIQQEFSSLIKSDKSDNVFSLYKSILYTTWKIKFIDAALHGLKLMYDEEIALHLVNLGYDFIIDNSDRQAYLRQVYLVETDAKVLIVQLSQYNNEYRIMCPKEDSMTAPTLMGYEKEMSILSKFMSFWIKKDEISVIEFCSIVNLYMEATKKEQ